MPFEARIRELSEELANCNNERALKIALELQSLIHERIEQLRAQVDGLPLLTASATSSPKPQGGGKNPRNFQPLD
jgi:predicted alpha-1,6-mannanase (GH76 family)